MNKSIKKIILVLICLCIFSKTLISFGHIEDKIDSIDINVEILENGSAKITEIWFVNSIERYSYYKAFKNLGNSKITKFSLEDLERKYEYIGNWDISMPHQEKAGKCGINYTNEGVELCWGVTKEGFNKYTISYEVSNFVKQYDECQGIRFDFIQSEMIPQAEMVTININSKKQKFTKKNVNVYNYGNNGKIELEEDGSIQILIDTQFSHITSLIKFSKEIKFDIKDSTEKTFKTIKRELEKQNGNTLKSQDKLVLTLLIVLSIIYLFCDIYRYIYHNKKGKV